MSGLDSRFPPLKVESRLMMFPNSQITSSEFYQHSTEFMTIIRNKIIKQHQNSPALINFFRKGFVCLLSLDFSFLFITTPGSPFMLFTSDKSTFSCLPTCDDSLCGVLLSPRSPLKLVTELFICSFKFFRPSLFDDSFVNSSVSFVRLWRMLFDGAGGNLVVCLPFESLLMFDSLLSLWTSAKRSS